MIGQPKRRDPAQLKMLFLRDVRSFTGGHLKLRDYIQHTASSGWVAPLLHVSPESALLAPADDPFASLGCARLDRLRPADFYFVAGEDWAMLDAAGIAPAEGRTINLVQGVRHAEPGGRLYGYLARPALRLCVSSAVAEAIQPFANGPIHVMPTAVSLPELPARSGASCDVFVSGFKAPELALSVAASLPAGVSVDLQCGHLPRPEFLRRIAAARVAVLLPLEREGFFLPPLEAMQLGVPVVTTDCLGSRDHCVHGVNCLIAPRTPQEIAAAAGRLLLDPILSGRTIASGRATAADRTLERERLAYLEILRGGIRAGLLDDLI